MKKKLVKKYKKKRGFTLIELLAVILILGIIALIAIPTVSSVVEQSRKGAAEQSVTTFVKLVEEMTVSKDLAGEKMSDGDYLVSDILNMDIDLKGTMPDSGYVTIKGNDVTSCQIVSGDYLITCIENNEKEVTRVDTRSFIPAENSSYLGMVYYNPTEGKKCSKADFEANLANYDTDEVDNNGNKYQNGLRSGCMIWYIYKDNGDGTINILLNHNIVTYDSYSLSKLKTLTSDWINEADFMSINDYIHIVRADEILNFDLSKTYLSRDFSSNNINYYFKKNVDSNLYHSFFTLQELYDYDGQKDEYRYFWLLENLNNKVNCQNCYKPKIFSTKNFLPESSSTGFFFKEKVNYKFSKASSVYWGTGSAIYYSEAFGYEVGFIFLPLVGGDYKNGYRPVITVNKSVFE